MPSSSGCWRQIRDLPLQGTCVTANGCALSVADGTTEALEQEPVTTPYIWRSLGRRLDYQFWPERERFVELDRAIAATAAAERECVGLCLTDAFDEECIEVEEEALRSLPTAA
jgi:hypothetical protein